MNDEELATHIGSICVSGEVLTGTALVKYLNLMPPKDKESMLDDLALLRAWAMLERTVPDAPNSMFGTKSYSERQSQKTTSFMEES